MVALFLGLWQWFDRRVAPAEPGPEDRAFFVRQDRRRYLGVAVMAVLAVLLRGGLESLARADAGPAGRRLAGRGRR